MVRETSNADKRRRERATKLHALQELREDYELLKLDALLHQAEITSQFEASFFGPSDRGPSGASFQTQRTIALASYYTELIYALHINLKVIANRAAAIQRSQDAPERETEA